MCVCGFQLLLREMRNAHVHLMSLCWFYFSYFFFFFVIVNWQILFPINIKQFNIIFAEAARLSRCSFCVQLCVFVPFFFILWFSFPALSIDCELIFWVGKLRAFESVVFLCEFIGSRKKNKTKSEKSFFCWQVTLSNVSDVVWTPFICKCFKIFSHWLCALIFHFPFASFT